VFDGRKRTPYVEDDTPSPLNAYGRSKAAAEAAALVAGDRTLMVRTAAFFSPHDHHNFAHHVVSELSHGRPFAAPADCVVSPTYTPDLVQAVLDLLIDGEKGVWHLTNGGAVSWADFAREIARATGLDPSLVQARPAETFGWAAKRPAYVPLESRRGRIMPSLEDAISRYAQALGANVRPAPRRKLAPMREIFAEPRSFAVNAEAS
jgi:dTDP-4-dehydrorhamnose reductase